MLSTQSLGAPDGRPRAQLFDEAFRKAYPHVTRWWLTLAHQPAFAAVLGEVKLCEQPMKFTPPKKEAGAKADGAAKEAAPKKEKEPKPAPKKVPHTPQRSQRVYVTDEKWSVLAAKPGIICPCLFLLASCYPLGAHCPAGLLP